MKGGEAQQELAGPFFSLFFSLGLLRNLFGQSQPFFLPILSTLRIYYAAVKHVWAMVFARKEVLLHQAVLLKVQVGERQTERQPKKGRGRLDSKCHLSFTYLISRPSFFSPLLPSPLPIVSFLLISACEARSDHQVSHLQKTAFFARDLRSTYLHYGCYSVQ